MLLLGFFVGDNNVCTSSSSSSVAVDEAVDAALDDDDEEEDDEADFFFRFPGDEAADGGEWADLQNDTITPRSYACFAYCLFSSISFCNPPS